tara:strand:- start:1937 stop:2701 length:765 start_codon:yes stop_codon:yes gene_type:complete
MAQQIKISDYLVNDVEKLTNLRDSLGISSWVDFAIHIDCSPSNLYDHVYTNSIDKKTGKPIYEKLLQPWHVKLFTLIKYLSVQKSKDDKKILEMILTPINPPAKLPSNCSLKKLKDFEEHYSEVISSGADLRDLIPLVSDAFDLVDSEMKKGARKRDEKPQTREEQQPLSFKMANLTGIAIRTYDSYIKTRTKDKDGNPLPPKPMRGIIAKIYTIVNYLLEEDRQDLVDILTMVDESCMSDYGVKRNRDSAQKK